VKRYNEEAGYLGGLRIGTIGASWADGTWIPTATACITGRTIIGHVTTGGSTHDADLRYYSLFFVGGKKETVHLSFLCWIIELKAERGEVLRVYRHEETPGPGDATTGMCAFQLIPGSYKCGQLGHAVAQNPM